MSKRLKKPARGFVGDLANPIVVDLMKVIQESSDKLSDAEIENFVNTAIRRARREQLLKLGKLLPLYKIDSKAPDRWLLLSLKLAEDFVPGMQIHYWASPRKRGRPPKWKGKRSAQLVEAVKRILAERKKGVSDAVRILQKRQPDVWGGPSGRGNLNTASLVARYYEAIHAVTSHRT